MRRQIRSLCHPLELLATLAVLVLLSGARAADAVQETEPDNSGPVKLVSASWLGGPFDDDLVAVALSQDLSIVVAGNAVDLTVPTVVPGIFGPLGMMQTASPPEGQKKGSWRHPSTAGFVMRVSPDGTKVLSYARFGYGAALLRKMKLDSDGNVYLLGDSARGVDLGNGMAIPQGGFLMVVSPDFGKVVRVLPVEGAMDFAVDGNGDVVVLSKAKLTRYKAGSRTEKWTATWKAYGDNRPGAMALAPESGVAAVVGYGMTSTGKEPYKDPYAYGFDRDGKQLWALWNPDPAKEKGSKYDGNGLMADTTGHAAAVTPDGKLLLMLYADGGNTVCMRDPLDVDKLLDSTVMDGVFQKTAGYGFRGASHTSVVFRVDAEKGTIEKGTWMSAWLDKGHANALSMDAAAGDDRGRQFVVGSSAFGCPTKDPWYTCKPGGYTGGGYLAILDRDFKMLQCGYFPGSTFGAVAARNGTVVVAGHARAFEDAETKTPVRIFKPLQGSFGGGDYDGYLAIFKYATP